ncbi:MAG: C13 family peptidase [Thermodesulfobacteriota bacterium]|nr:C13 family peptidase [Thermodesulfobacteriota bacterium]
MVRSAASLEISPSGPLYVDISSEPLLFTASGGYDPVTWQAKCGTLSATKGRTIFYFPSDTACSDTLTIRDRTGETAHRSIEVSVPGMTITPVAGFMLPGEEKQFSLLGAGPDCRWDAPLGGDIVSEQDNLVTYKAPGITGEYALVAMDLLSGDYVRAMITVVDNHLEITPQSAVLERNGSQHFAVTGGMPPYIWTVDQGDLNTTTGKGVFYTSPGITGQYVITARDAGGRTVSAQIDIKGDFRITPVVSVALPGEEVNFSLMGASGDPSWVAEAGRFTSQNQTEAVLKTPLQTGTYDITAMDPNGDMAWSRVYVVDDTLFIQGAGESVISGDVVSLSVSGGIGPYAWTADQGLLSATSGSRVTWIAPDPGPGSRENGESLTRDTVVVTVSDSMGSVAAEEVIVGAEELRPLSVSTKSLSIPLGNKGMIPVTGGSTFTAVSGDSSIAGCTTRDNQVIITANAVGSAVITVSDGSGRSFDVPVTVTGKNLAVIVAGSGPYPGNALWDHTLACVQNAFRVLLAQGYTSDTIYLLSADADVDMDFNGDGMSNDIDAFADSDGLRYALTTWAAGAEDLFVYITGHGSDQRFRLNPDTFLAAADLGQWLDQTGSAIDGTLVFLYDACRSGSFLPPLKGEKRIIIASTGKDELAYFTSMGSLSFSNFFFDGVFNGADVLDACLLAKNAVEYTYTSQHPLFDDNGNGIGNDDNDGAAARKMIIGSGMTAAADIPLIKEISGETVISTGEYAEIYADNILSGKSLDRVWAVITPPDKLNNDPEEPVLELPVVDLSREDSGTRYQGRFDGFSNPGIYNIAAFAKDRDGGVSMPRQTRVIVMNGNGACVSAFDCLDLFFPCVRVGGETFRLSMDYISGLTWQINADSLAAAVSDQGCITVEDDLSLYIPCCRYGGTTLSFTMTYTDGPTLTWSIDPDSLVVGIIGVREE